MLNQARMKNRPFITVSAVRPPKLDWSEINRDIPTTYEDMRVYYSSEMKMYFAYIKKFDKNRSASMFGDFSEIGAYIELYYKGKEINLNVVYPDGWTNTKKLLDLIENENELSEDTKWRLTLSKYLLLLLEV